MNTEEFTTNKPVAESKVEKINYKRKDYLQWNDYFMATALLSAQRSKDPVTQVGACIVDNEKRILAIGYNGFPRNCHDDEFPWCKLDVAEADADDIEDKKMYVVHAEANAILNLSGSNSLGAKLYTTLFPCNECAKLIIQSGIHEVYYLSNKYAKKRSYRASQRMFDAVGIKCTKYTPLKKKIVIDFETFIEYDLERLHL